jgi:hypothetical protein
MSWMKFLGFLFAGYLAFQGVILLALGPEMGPVSGGVIGGGAGTLAFGLFVAFLVHRYL